MKREPLLVVANLIAGLCCLWAWQMWSSASAQQLDSQKRLAECQQLCGQVQKLKVKLKEKLVVAAPSFDPSRIVQEQWKKSGLPNDKFTLSQYRGRMDHETDLKLWGIRLPQVEASLGQTVVFIAGLADSEAGIQVGRIGLSKTKTSKSQKSDETWQVTFDDVTYLKRSDPERQQNGEGR